MQALGIDVGGSGIKGMPVDIQTGKLLAERVRIKTPDKAEPKPMAEIAAQVDEQHLEALAQIRLVLHLTDRREANFGGSLIIQGL